VSVATFATESYETVAVTGPEGPVRVKFVPFIVEGFIAREKVAVTTDERATKVPPSPGVRAVTVGAGGGGGGTTVVKDHDTALDIGVPSVA
jgi:hypothetical protein